MNEILRTNIRRILDIMNDSKDNSHIIVLSKYRV